MEWLERNGDLMLLLSYLLSRNPEWRDADIQIKSIASNQLMQEKTERLLAQLKPEIRIKARIEVMVKPESITVKELIHQQSAKADLVFLGLATPEEEGGGGLRPAPDRSRGPKPFLKRLVQFAKAWSSARVLAGSGRWVWSVCSSRSSTRPSRPMIIRPGSGNRHWPGPL